MPRLHAHAHHRPASPRRSGRGTRLCASLTILLGLAALAFGTGCGPSNELQPANGVHHPGTADDSRNQALEKQIAELEAERRAGDEVLPIFMIGDGDDYRMLELPGNDAPPATATDNARNVPIAFMIPASPDSATGRAETLQRIAVGVLFLDVSRPQKIYRLADFSRAKLSEQVCRKAFNSYTRETGLKLPDALSLQEGYPAIFSAAFIYRDLDMIESEPAAKPAPQPATTSAGQTDDDTAADGDTAKPKRNIRVIRSSDIDTFLKNNKADVLALMVVQIDERNRNEQLVALWLWSRDPVTNTLFQPSACVQSKKIDQQWPEASESEQVHMWHSLIDLERRLAEQKTVVVDRPRLTTP